MLDEPEANRVALLFFAKLGVLAWAGAIIAALSWYLVAYQEWPWLWATVTVGSCAAFLVIFEKGSAYLILRQPFNFKKYPPKKFPTGTRSDEWDH